MENINLCDCHTAHFTLALIVSEIITFKNDNLENVGHGNGE